MRNFKEKISHVKAFVFDCDGVFTDGKMTPIPGGEMLRSYNAKDGYSVAMAIKKGYHVAIITGGVGELVRERFQMLGVDTIYMNCFDKINAIKEFMEQKGLSKEQVLYMGDDLPDIAPMEYIGVPTAPADAVYEVKSVACYISDKNGGSGCVRDVVEQVLKSQNNWMVKHADQDIMSR